MTVESVFASLGWRILFLSLSLCFLLLGTETVGRHSTCNSTVSCRVLPLSRCCCVYTRGISAFCCFISAPFFPLGEEGPEHGHTHARQRESASRTVQQQKANTQSPRATKENNQRKLTTNIAAHSTTPISKNGKKTSNEPKRRESSSGGS